MTELYDNINDWVIRINTMDAFYERRKLGYQIHKEIMELQYTRMFEHPFDWKNMTMGGSGYHRFMVLPIYRAGDGQNEDDTMEPSDE